MCGIVGVAGNLFQKDEELIQRLLWFDYLRGKDATGLASIRTNGDIQIAKLASDPVTLFNTIKFNTTCSGAASKALIGHNRHATRGKATDNGNAHPFQYDHITGAHNGTLDVTSWNALEEALGERYEVDSKALIAAIAKIGIKDAIELCTTGKDASTGAWSLVWYDKNEDSLNFLRNAHRPMWIAYEKDFRRMFWASEWWMLDAAFKSIGTYDPYKEEKTNFQYFPTEEDLHYKIQLDDLVKGQDKPPLEIAETQVIAGKEPVVVAATQSHFPTTTKTNTQNGNDVGFHTPKNKGNSDAVIHWLGSDMSPYAGYIKKEKFEELSKYGCSWCQADIMYGDPGITIYEGQDMMLCASCSGHDDVDTDTATRIYVTPTAYKEIAL